MDEKMVMVYEAENTEHEVFYESTLTLKGLLLCYGGNIKIKSIHKATDDDIKRILNK